MPAIYNELYKPEGGGLAGGMPVAPPGELLPRPYLTRAEV